MPSIFSHPNQNAGLHTAQAWNTEEIQADGSTGAPINVPIAQIAQPLSEKEKRRSVKKIVAAYEKLKNVGIRTDADGSLASARSTYIESLTAAQTRLSQLIASGLTPQAPPFSMSRSTKNKAALTGGAATKAAQIGAAGIAVVGCGAVVAAATPVALVRGVQEGVAGVLCWEPESITHCIATAAEPITSTYKFVRGTGDPWQYHHDRVAEIFRRISLLPQARQYAARPRLPTATIATTAVNEISADLTQLYRGLEVPGQDNLPTVTGRTGQQSARFVASHRPAGSLPATSGMSSVSSDPAEVRLAVNVPQAHRWQFQENEDDAEAFNTFQSRLTSTAEYNNIFSKSGLVRRVDALVLSMRASPALRALCFTIAADSIQNCGDRIALGLNDMEQALISDNAATGRLSVDGLFHTGLGLFKKQILDEIAVARITALRHQGRDIDEIEIRLAYPTELRDRLGLQGVAPSMHYRASAKVTPRDIDAAQTAVKTRMQCGEGVEFLANWQPWRASLQRANASMYDELHALIQRDRDAISQMPAHMNEQQWCEALAEQKCIEETHHCNLARQLTQQFITAHQMAWA